MEFSIRTHSSEASKESSMIATPGCQLDHICNELQLRNGWHTPERFSAWFEMDESIVGTSEVGRHTSDLDLGRGRHTFNLVHTCWKPT